MAKGVVTKEWLEEKLVKTIKTIHLLKDLANALGNVLARPSPMLDDVDEHIKYLIDQANDLKARIAEYDATDGNDGGQP